MTDNNICAVRMPYGWRLATKALSSSYGLLTEGGTDGLVWCEIGTTALVGVVGEELACVDLLPHEPPANTRDADANISERTAP